MGGIGSGRHNYARTPTVEECAQIDADDLTEGVDHPGAAYVTREWQYRDGRSIELTGHFEATDDEERATHVRLEYTVDPVRREAFDESHPVGLEYTEPNYGGVRPWFRCPGVADGEHCRRRARKLYLPPGGRYWLCRECYDLGYQSSRTSGDDVKQAELRYRRAFAKADAKNRRPHPNNPPFTPDRPKGMHHDTFEDLVAEVQAAETEWAEEMNAKMREMAKNLDRDGLLPAGES